MEQISNNQMPDLLFDLQDGNYECPQILSIQAVNNHDCEIYYSINDSALKKYYGPIALTSDSIIKAHVVKGIQKGKEFTLNIRIQPNDTGNKGSVVVIGGAEHCREIHEKLVELAGGNKKARIVFIPTSSTDAYASGIDRVTRFKELAGLDIDLTLIPEKNNKKDFSAITDLSSFWILPVATLDDVNTNQNPEDNPDTLLADESLFPDLDESKWILNGFDKNIAVKLRDGNYNLIFLTGGNQARYIKCFYYPDGTESPVLSIIRYLHNQKGATIVGTSAGGAVLSEIMMLGGGSYGALVQGVIYEDVNIESFKENYTPFVNKTDGRLWIGKGFGILPNNFITDTHFVARGRLGRLIAGALYIKENFKRNIIGIGSDEDTAVIIHPNGEGEVVGALGAILIDVSEANILKGNIQKGNSHIEGIVVHYLEAGDKFEYDAIAGKIKEIVCSPQKKQIEKGTFNEEKIRFIEHDIFGRDKIKRILFDYLANEEAEQALGIAMTDNLEDSYDEIPVHKVEETGSVLLSFVKKADTKAYKGLISYHWWGPGDEHYPNLIHQEDTDRFSVFNVRLDVLPLLFTNFPDLSDAKHLPLRSDYTMSGEDNIWYEKFDDTKNYYFGCIVKPLLKGTVQIITFFFDYAYYDLDNNRFYSPPKLRPINVKEEYSDYEISEMVIATDVKVYINEDLVGATDLFGTITLPINNQKVNVKLIYEGFNTYQINFYSEIMLTENATIIFGDKSNF